MNNDAPSLPSGLRSTISRVTQQYEVTSVGVNPAEDRAHRMRMYLLAMSLRVACVVSLFWVKGWWVLIAGLGAVILPYIAVLVGNAVANNPGEQPEAPSPLELPSFEAPSAAEPAVHPSASLIVVDAPSTFAAPTQAEPATVPDSSQAG